MSHDGRPDRAEVLKRARKLINRRRSGDAIPILQDLLAHDERDTDARYLMALARFRLKSFDRALREFEMVLTFDPRHTLSLHYCGLCLKRMGDQRRARTYFTRCTETDPDFEPAHKELRRIDAELADPHPVTTLAPRMSTLDGALARILDQGGQVVSTAELVRGELLLDTTRRISSYLEVPVLLLITLATFVVAATTEMMSWMGPLALLLMLVTAIASVRAYVLGWRHRYKLYERRIDVSVGLLERQAFSVWLYEIKDLRVESTPLEVLTNNATIVLIRDGGSLRLVGLGKARFVMQLWEELRDAAIVERRAMKKWWL